MPVTAPRTCAVVPTYDNTFTIRNVVERISAYLPEIIVVDDGSGPACREAVEGLARDGLARVVHRERNGGKGAAVRDGLRAADALGFTHAIQIDADGQHDLDDLPHFLDTANAAPAALVLGCPMFDDRAPRSRVRGRLISRFWTDLETGGRIIADPLCGFRVYPVADAVRSGARANRMGFDPEIAVRMVWGGSRVVNLPTRVRYLTPEEGGVSHFRMFRDNVEISWTHARLCAGALLRLATGRRIRPPR
jgi:glycosyltransferase involved in cell wall biosynthesis